MTSLLHHRAYVFRFVLMKVNCAIYKFLLMLVNHKCGAFGNLKHFLLTLLAPIYRKTLLALRNSSAKPQLTQMKSEEVEIVFSV